MWGKKDNTENPTVFGEADYTFLGKDVDLQGKAMLSGTVRIDGAFDGEIVTQDTLIIGEHAVIKGTITGRIIVCGGRVEGIVTASEKIQLMNPAVLIGDIHAPVVSMEEGVLFHGMCDMEIRQVEADMARPVKAIEKS